MIPMESTTLITADELSAALSGEHPPALLDVRWQLGRWEPGTPPPGAEDYAAGHIPGAHFIALDTDLAAPPGPGGRHPLPDPEVLGTAMRAAGVSADREVVVYDAATSASAARAWWLLRWAGHSRVRVLDGGLAAWSAAGLPLQQEAPATEQGDFIPAPGTLPTVGADAAAVLARTGLLLDARAGERYRGETEPIDPRAGHIPGAVSAPTTDNLLPDGRFRPAAELAERFAELGVKPDTEIAVYCGSGVTAAHELLALSLAGFDGALYPGSWSEWSSNPNRPAETSN
jgi:thiosulfate/3-mercaptopyruvate sulfurtransferase